MQQAEAQASARHDIIVVGASIGGIEALTSLLSQLPGSFPASILIVLHLHPESPSVLDRILSSRTNLTVKFAQEGEVLRHGSAYLAPPDQHLLVKDGKALLSHGPRENRSRPAIDPLFRSAAVAYGSRVVGVILSGLLDDGTAGLQAIKECGGVAVAQDPKDAQYADMPISAIENVEVDHVVPLADMGALLARLVEMPAPEASIPEHLKREVEISQGLTRTDMEENIMGTLVPMVCPECGGALTGLPSGKGMRYRCHEGHAFGQLHLVDAQYDKMESALWSAVRIMEEQANMLKRMARHHKSIPRSSKNHYGTRAKEIEASAEHIRDFLLHIMKRKV